MNFTINMPWNVHDLRRVYEQTNSGHWFSPNTMRFFKTRLTSSFKRVSDKEAYFITTEQGPMNNSPRLATVRRAVIEDIQREGGALISKVNIETVREFNSLTMYQAKKVLKEIGGVK